MELENKKDPLLIQALNLLSLVVWQYGDTIIKDDETELHFFDIDLEKLKDMDIEIHIFYDKDGTTVKLECEVGI